MCGTKRESWLSSLSINVTGSKHIPQDRLTSFWCRWNSAARTRTLETPSVSTHLLTVILHIVFLKYIFSLTFFLLLNWVNFLKETYANFQVHDCFLGFHSSRFTCLSAQKNTSVLSSCPVVWLCVSCLSEILCFSYSFFKVLPHKYPVSSDWLAPTGLTHLRKHSVSYLLSLPLDMICVNVWHGDCLCALWPF